jgi:hypothetical protein
MTENYHKHLSSITRAVALAILLMTAALSASAFESSFYSDTSRLATGKWVKVAVNESGIYQITASDASKWGLGDLSRIHVFGYGGAPLSDNLVSTAFFDDLPQVPVVRTGDRILFYGRGPITWSWSSEYKAYLQKQHPYATQGYYFITDDARYSDITLETKPTNPVGTVVNTFNERLFHEEELINPGETGRNLLGEDFTSTNTQSFKFTLTDMVDGSNVSVVTRFATKTLGNASNVSFKYNGNNIAGNLEIPAISSSDPSHYHYNAEIAAKEFSLSGTKDLTYSVTYSPSGTVNLARLDYVTVCYKRPLDMSGKSSLVFGLRNNEDTQYELSGVTSNTHLWDVSSKGIPVEYTLNPDNSKVRFSILKNRSQEFVAFNDNGSFPSPTLVGNVDNQSIHGLPIPDMIILAPSEFLPQAQQLANLHENVDSMRVLVLDHHKVFNEFSSGTPDAAAYRMLCKYFFDRGTDAEGHHLGYLLLLGNGYCDNRLLSIAGRSLRYPMLLVWESPASEDEMSSYTSDDFFGYLQDGSIMGTTNKMDIAVGRIPARSTTSASIAVNKIIKYVTQADYGNWKNTMLNVADNEDSGSHWRHGEAVIQTVAANGGENTNFNRVFLDDYEAQSDGSGNKFPEARKKMYKTLTEGALWWNYSGHGGPSGWTGDGLLVTSDIENNLFYSHQPILFAATCEFLRHDGINPSGGENVFFNPNGGSIALLCPPRLVYMDNNRFLNITAATKMYNRDSNGQVMRLGDLLTYAKNNTFAGQSNSLRYHLFGDPAMRPAMPQLNAIIDQINGKDVSESDMPVFEARQTITVTGHIENLAGEKESTFNGLIESTLYDCEKSVSFSYSYNWRNPSTGETEQRDSTLTYEERQNKLSLNVTRVNNGEFSFNITIPSEVTVSYDNYRPSLVSLYAYDPDKKVEATGSCDDFYIYGYDESVVADTIGPDISYMGLNSNNFSDGDNVNESPLLLASVSDESGINFSNAGIGHNMTLTLDGNVTYSDVSSYYTAVEAEKGSAGNISYGLSDLSNGHHTLKLKVWDVFNNSSEKTISFNVMSGLKPEIDEIKAFPNPAATTTTFIVTHNRPEATVTVTIEVFNLMGQRMWSTTQSGRSSMFSSFPITWDLSDYSGSRLQRGIYLYRATISTDGHQESTKTKKLAITAM